MQPTLLERYRGCLLGLACGDAVGTAVEFQPRGSFEPLSDMIGGGPFCLAAGEWTDDTSMALCLATSLVEANQFDARDQMERYVRWWRTGYLSATGECFDIGVTTAASLRRFEMTGQPYSGDDHPRTAGNGSLMRLAPVVLYCYPDMSRLSALCADSSRTTHGAPEAVECCVLLGHRLASALTGKHLTEILRESVAGLTEPKVKALASDSFVRKVKRSIAGSGYAIESLEAALWCFARTTTFEAAVLAAANLGDDADTTAAIAGQLAGAYYGVDAIPSAWLSRLAMRSTIEALAGKLYVVATDS